MHDGIGHMGRHPPGADPPWEQTSSPTRHPPGADTPSPPGAEQAGRYGQRTGGTHPTGMQSCLNINIK